MFLVCYPLGTQHILLRRPDRATEFFQGAIRPDRDAGRQQKWIILCKHGVQTPQTSGSSVSRSVIARSTGKRALKSNYGLWLKFCQQLAPCNALLCRFDSSGQGSRSSILSKSDRYAAAKLRNGLLLQISERTGHEHRRQEDQSPLCRIQTSGHLLWCMIRQQILDLYDEQHFFDTFANSFGEEFTEEYITRFGEDQRLDLIYQVSGPSIKSLSEWSSFQSLRLRPG